MKFIVALILCFCNYVFADEATKVCKPPIHTQTLTYQQSTNTPINFAGFIIELPSPKKIGYFNEDLILKYDQDRTIYLTYSSNTLTEGRQADYDPVAVFNEAFGISPRQDKNKSEIQAIINHQRLCDNELINYQISGINNQVIRTKYQNKFNDNTINTYILGKSKDVYMITFKGFSNSEIDQLLSTIHKVNSK